MAAKAKREEFRLEPDPPAKQRESPYVFEVRYWNQDDEEVVMRGTRAPHRRIDRDIAVYCRDSGIPLPPRILAWRTREVLKRQTRAANQTSIAIDPAPTDADHPVLRGLEVANWTKRPRAGRLLNEPTEPRPQKKLSVQQRELLTRLDDDDREWVSSLEFADLYAYRQTRNAALTELLERGLIEKWSPGPGKPISVRRTATPWRSCS